MSMTFIVFCFIEFFIFTFLAFKLTCKYLPIINNQSVAILLAFMLCYLIQAALFLRIRKTLGAAKISEQLSQTYDVYIRAISLV